MATAWRIVRPATEDQRWHRHLDEAVMLIRAGRLCDAERVVDEAIGSAPDDASVTGRAWSFKGEIASIRGVDPDGVIRTLQARGYVGEVGRDPGPGQAILFGTTPLFLEKLITLSKDGWDLNNFRRVLAVSVPTKTVIVPPG